MRQNRSVAAVRSRQYVVVWVRRGGAIVRMLARETVKMEVQMATIRQIKKQVPRMGR